ncbi:MAG: hypothetical protein M3Z05_04135 [Gemmatimonadota bacterium]|nr:hypothetical protein [Gemmatimonadota bacterium]
MVPRLTRRISDVPIGAMWEDTRLILPEGSSTHWHGLIHGEQLAAADGTLRLADILSAVPVAALSSIRPPSSDPVFT